MSCKPSACAPLSPTEGERREQLAAYFLAAPPLKEQTPEERQKYLSQLSRLAELERREILDGAGAARPLVWGNPVPYVQALLTAAQRMGAGLGQPLLLFPAKETDIRFDTLLHPRLLGIALMNLIGAAVRAAPRQPVWVRLSEHRHCLAVAVTGTVPFGDEETLALLKESTRLHEGSLVLCDTTVSFSCGQAGTPPPGVRLYSSPTAEILLRDTLSPVWTAFYSGIYASLSSSKDPASVTDASEADSASADTAAASDTEDSSSCSG